jgi:hypothetical protein
VAATRAPSSEQIPAESDQPVGAATAAADEEAEQASPEAAAASGDKQRADESPMSAAESVPQSKSGSKSIAAGAESNSDNSMAEATSAVAASGGICQNRLCTCSLPSCIHFLVMEDI